MSRSRTIGDVFSPRMRRFVLVLLFLSAGAVVATLLYGARLVTPSPGEADSYGGGPLGHRAFAETMEALGWHVMQSRGDRFDGPEAPLLFIEPQDEARVEGRLRRLDDAITTRTAAGLPTLVVLPKWTFGAGLSMGDPSVGYVPDDRLHAVFDAALPTSGLDETPRIHRGDDRHARHTLVGLLGTFEVEVPELQTIQRVPPGAEVLLDAATGAVVLREARGTIVVSDPDLIHSFNFHRADHASLWVALLERSFTSDALGIDEVFHGHGRVLSLKTALGKFPAVLLVAHGLVLLLLLVMLGSKRFGPPLGARDLGHGPQEAISVAASVLADGQPIGRLAYNYVVEVVQDLHRQLGLPSAPTLAARAARIDAVAKQRQVPPAAEALLRRAHALGDDRKAQNDAWAVARAAHQFRARLLGSAPGGAPRRAPTASSDKEKTAA
ncbi:MAG TPA: hypothetical protein RMH85_09565 [Polyangiaceae bacterium LLY-WYZ-15_(1-7)]|nr:hypothetical protein [Sandaracinus sp.]HJK93467.1 hypothetical protein [Polyangiaceae bacterium LLY-WYZ-15_(1-7)]MBJ74318.1 hypothetical protein [Sandaracinus sp.]HJL04878.1 hypothetical protein [Polyangiaceae bacterium LLY-WYZ-15_(1-7)]HJL08735.1 hypothetical protein [Polyangiaceae bacterium LLY-WYZ-15_(1-7)]